MKRKVFQLLSKMNKILLPRISKKNLNRLSKVDKAVVAFRYWVTINSLE